jgi:hypothetical protein
VTIKRDSHVSDERLVEVCVDRTPTPEEDVHLSRCDACGVRRSRLEGLLQQMFNASVAEADLAFSDERLATQRARILHRIEQDGRPARVIAFPASTAVDARPLRARPAARWIAAAAAAGLAIGLLAGHLAHDWPAFNRPERTAYTNGRAPSPAERPTLRVVNASMSDEEFLGEVENALDGPHLIALRPLNDLTPQ